MHGAYKKSTAQGAALSLGHLAVCAVVVWLLFGGGLESFGLEPGSFTRRALLAICSAIYFLRMLCTTHVMMSRSMEWSEVAVVLPWLWIIHLTYALLGGVQRDAPGPVAWLGLGAYVVGSYLNTASETQRMLWKGRPENRGRLYTGGLFRYSMHVNYFGDTVLFTGFAMLTGSWWSLLIPLAMTLGFWRQHIPQLDAYLRERYGSEFEDYASTTSRFVPFF